jgi:transcriptional regulator with XRE-family HTH domain
MLCPNIKITRLKNEMSKEYVAIQMEISIREYEKIENGIVDLKLSKLSQLAKIFGVKKSYLCENLGN